MKKRLRKSEYELLASFRFSIRRFLRFSEEAARSLGIEPQQHQALLAVEGYPGQERVTLGRLAEQLQIRHHSAVGLVNRLVKQGLIARSVDQVDRRQVYVTLTSRGKDLLEKLSSAHRDEIRNLGPVLSDLLKQLS